MTRSTAAIAATVALPAVARAPTHLDRFGGDRRIRLVTIDDLRWNGLLQQFLDISQQLVLIDTDQGNGLAFAAGTAGATDAVHIILGDIRQFIVDHMGQLVDIETASRDVGGHQHANIALLEAGQGLGARALALVAVDRSSADAILAQLFRQAVGAMLGAGEHQHLPPLPVTDQPGQQFALARLVHRVNALRYPLGGGVALRHLDLGRVVQQAVGQLTDGRIVGGREQQVLALARQQREHLLDIVDEAHVEHAVGFVEHENLHRRQIQGFLADMIEQTPRRGHQDIDAATQAVDLRVDLDAAEDHRRFQR